MNGECSQNSEREIICNENSERKIRKRQERCTGIPLTPPPPCSENIYTAYIRPLIEYGHTIYDNTNDTNSKRLESVQRKAAIACTGAYINTSHDRLLAELGWLSLKQRREDAKLVNMFKMVKGLSPAYLQAILPETRDMGNRYALRNTVDIIQPKTRLQSFKKSFLPDGICLWNNLQIDTRNAPSLHSFKQKLKSRRALAKRREYSMGCGVSSIHLARIRMNMSGLNQHLYNCNIVLYKNCLCNVHVTEDVDHFFWTCPRYESHRQTMIFDLSTIIPNQMPISITKSGRKHITSVIINGDTSISVNENLSIFHIVERYVNNTKRFM